MKFPLIIFIMIIQKTIDTSLLFDVENYTTMIPILYGSDSMFGYDFHIYFDSSSQTYNAIVGAPKDSPSNSSIKCGSINKCAFQKMAGEVICHKDNQIYNEFSGQMFNYDLMGYHINHLESIGTLIFSPLKQFMYQKNPVMQGRGGLLINNTNSTSPIALDHFKTSFNTRERHALGFSSVYLKDFDIFIISDPISFGGRGEAMLFNRSLHYISRFKLGYLQFSYSGLTLKSIKMEDDVTKTHLIYSGETKSRKALFIMEIRKEMGSDEKTQNIFTAQSMELKIGTEENMTIDAHFGFDVLCLDINNDGWDDIIASAPYGNNGRGVVLQYSRKITNKIYRFVYRGKLTGDNLEYCHFGYSMADLGDMNGDQISEIAISAPFCSSEDGGGSIYIYLSRKNQRGFTDTYFDKIHATSFKTPLDSFGLRIKTIPHLENNRVKDLAISAPFDNKLIFIKLKKIISVNITAEYYIPLNEELNSTCKRVTNNSTVPCIIMKLCAYISHYYESLPDEFEILFVMDMIPNEDFDLNMADNYISHNYTIKVNKNHLMCVDIKVFLERPISIYSEPASISLNYDVHLDPKLADSVNFLNLNKNPLTFKLDYSRNCIDINKCSPNLVLKVDNSSELFNRDIFIGEDQKFNYTFTIFSSGVPAHNSNLTINLSSGIEITGFESNNWNLEPYQIYQDSYDKLSYVLKLPLVLETNRTISINVNFLATKITQETEARFIIRLNCEFDSDLSDNSISFVRIIRKQYKLQLNGGVTPSQLILHSSWSQKNDAEQNMKKHKLTTSYFLNNLGPSPSDNVRFKVNVPSAIDGLTLIKNIKMEIPSSELCHYKEKNFSQLFSSYVLMFKFREFKYIQIDCNITNILPRRGIKVLIEFLVLENITYFVDKNKRFKVPLLSEVTNNGKLSNLMSLIVIIKEDIPLYLSMNFWIIIMSVCIGICATIMIGIIFKNLLKKWRRRHHSKKSQDNRILLTSIDD